MSKIKIEELKKGNLFLNKTIIYRILDNDLQKKVIKLIKYEIHIDALGPVRRFALDQGSKWSRFYIQLEKNDHFRSSKKVNERWMRYFISGVFGDIK